jgi:hypothetical protein
VVVLLSFLAAGVLLGLFACIPSFFRQRRAIAGLRKELKAVGRPVGAPGAGPLPDPVLRAEGVAASGSGSSGASPPLGV